MKIKEILFYSAFPCFSQVTALILAAVFIYTSCSMPQADPSSAQNTNTDTGQSPPTVTGTPVAFYLDENLKPTTTPTGITALTVLDNEDTKGSTVLSYEDDEGGIVDFIVPESNAAVSMYFEGTNNFPDRLIIEQEGERIAYGYFSEYNTESQTYYIHFTIIGEGEGFTNQIFFNKNVLTAYQNDINLDDSQNLRINRIMTALCVWATIDKAVDDMKQGAFRNILKTIVKVFVPIVVIAKVVVPVVAVAVFAPVALSAVIPLAIERIWNTDPPVTPPPPPPPLLPESDEPRPSIEVRIKAGNYNEAAYIKWQEDNTTPIPLLFDSTAGKDLVLQVEIKNNSFEVEGKTEKLTHLQGVNWGIRLTKLGSIDAEQYFTATVVEGAKDDDKYEIVIHRVHPNGDARNTAYFFLDFIVGENAFAINGNTDNKADLHLKFPGGIPSTYKLRPVNANISDISWGDVLKPEIELAPKIAVFSLPLLLK
ncbi:MAG: hypothetical protein Ta2F_16770 [Termitinemataceae bacterium]|nr:MAG: hypothetical protein Ta2F_16770 [Termitinemataceae bacterium]